MISLTMAAPLPRIMPLGSSGGCHTILTEVSLTSGNTSLTGGPGTERKTEPWSRHWYTPSGCLVRLHSIWWASWAVTPMADTIHGQNTLGSGRCFQNLTGSLWSQVILRKHLILNPAHLLSRFWNSAHKRPGSPGGVICMRLADQLLHGLTECVPSWKGRFH